MASYDFSGKTVLVSGAGKGIGKQIVLSFAQAGANIAFFDKVEDNVGEVVKELELLKVKTVTGVVDINDEKVLDQFLKKVYTEFNQIDVLVNNVGIGLTKRFFDTTPGVFDTVMNTNFRGPFFLTQKVSSKMEEGSNIIFISSIHSAHPSRDPSYDASKAAIDNLVLNLALVLAPKGIRVNIVSPGHTDVNTNVNPRDQKDVPLYKKAGTSLDTARACMFLSDNSEAHYITGINIPVTGGLHIPIALDIHESGEL